MIIKNISNEQAKAEMHKALLSCGSVYLGEFKNIDHKKYFIIVGMSADKIFICSVFINSNIPNAILKRQKLLNLQVPIKGAKYDFLRYDSFVSCNNYLNMQFSDIYNSINAGKCKYIGKIDNQDLENVKESLINSGLLTPKEMELYFH